MLPEEDESDFVDRLYEASLRPERSDALILQWDAHLAQNDHDLELRLADVCSEPFTRHLKRAIAILDSLNSLEFEQLDKHLAAIPNPALVLAVGGNVVASNQAARSTFSLYPAGSIRSLAIEPTDLQQLIERVAHVGSQSGSDSEILRCRSLGGQRDFHVHLRPIDGGQGVRHVLVVSSEMPWNGAVAATLKRAFNLTGAEVAVVQRLHSGASIGEIAFETGRRESTIRSQFHAILGKTGTQSQAEVLRLVSLLHTSMAINVEPSRRLPPSQVDDAPSRQLTTADGRKLIVLRFGDPQGRTVIWLQSQLGFFTPTRSGEADLRRLGIRVLVPIRAGYGPSDPLPRGRDVLDVAVDDLLAVMDRLKIARAPVVALIDDIWIALTLARRAPDRVAHVLGISVGFPIMRPEHYRRLHPIGRFFRACARHAPQLLPFLLRLIRARMIRTGIESHARANLRSPADLAAMDDPEISDAWMAGFTYLYGTGSKPEAALCAELTRFHRDWPHELGEVACPVTLLHGEEDGNNPFETAQEIARTYPSWRFLSRPHTGQLAVYSCWDDVVTLLCQALEDADLGSLVTKSSA